MENMLEIENLTLAYHKKPILENFNLSVGRGDIYGIIGNNGVGKTTLLKAITGLLRYKQGKITIHAEGRKKPLIGTIIEKPGLFKDMSAYENIKAKALLLGVKYKKADIAKLLQKVGLGDVGRKRTGAFSMGMKQRLGIALALVGEPDILVLDEPINGLDPQGINEVRNLLLKIYEETGLTMLISSHILGELSRIATHFLVMGKGGRIIRNCTKEEFMKECGEENIDDYYVKLVEQAETAQNWESTDSVETPQDRENEDSTPPRAE
jgi:ABC-2 type transport system ATP-binding protein